MKRLWIVGLLVLMGTVVMPRQAYAVGMNIRVMLTATGIATTTDQDDGLDYEPAVSTFEADETTAEVGDAGGHQEYCRASDVT